MHAVKARGAYFILAAAVIMIFICLKPAQMEDRHPAFSVENYESENITYEDVSTAYEKGGGLTKKGWHIHVNLDQTTLYLFRDGEYVKSYPVSGGASNSPSPLGNWKIISKETWGEGFGGVWLGFNVPWGMYGIHGTSEPWFIGKSNSSQGCIRMYNKDAKELFGLVPYGATVTIVHEGKAFRTIKDGDVGSDVLEVQKALKTLGYYPWYADGRFGRLLETGIRQFQRDNGLWSSGRVNRDVYDLIVRKAGEYGGGGD